MHLKPLLNVLHQKAIELRRNGDGLGIRGPKGAVEPGLMEHIKAHKAAILEMIDQSGQAWWCPPWSITPEMLPLVQLTQAEIDHIVATVPGGLGNVKDIYPLTPLQEGILFHHLLSTTSDAYLIAGVTPFRTRERLEASLEALKQVVARHDILRTSFCWEGLPTPVQVVQRSVTLPVEEVTLDPEREGVEQLHERFNPEHYRLDVRQAPLFKLIIAHEPGQSRWLFMVLLHHLIGDHTTLDAINEEVYLILKGESDKLPVPTPYRNLVAQVRASGVQETHETFFKAMLADVDTPTAPFDLLDVQGDGRGIVKAYVELDRSLVRRLKDRCKRLGVSTASVCHQAWALVLASLTGQEDVVFGTVLFGRGQMGDVAHKGIGLFINTLPIRVSIKGEPVLQAVRETHGKLLQLMRHEHAALSLAQRCSGVQPPAPLFTTLLNYRHADGGEYEGAHKDVFAAKPKSEETPKEEQSLKEDDAIFEGASAAAAARLGRDFTNYPFTLTAKDFGEVMTLHAMVHDAVDAKQICALWEGAFTKLVDALELAPHFPLNRLDIMDEETRHTLLNTWNDTGRAWPALCVHQWVEAQAARVPQAVAVQCGGETLTYEGLNGWADSVAKVLRQQGVGPDERVGLCVERGPGMVVGLLAILKAGGAYVPLDPAYPLERLRHILHSSAPRVLLTESDLPARLGFLAADLPCPVLNLADIPQEAGPQAPLTEPVSPHHLAYVIYTSGSTGLPKGVMIPHRAVVNMLLHFQEALGFTSQERLLAITTMAFDIAALEIFLPLVSGAAILLATREEAADPLRLAEKLRQESATVLQATPVTWQMLVGAGWAGAKHLKALCGGEALSAGLVAALQPRVGRLWNVYGPTETTVWSTTQEIAPGRSVQGAVAPIGRPIANTQVYVLNSQQRLVPVGAPGELYIGGWGLAKGYMGRDDLTAERFVQNPFLALRTAGGESAQLYRTGDLARWRPDGTLEYLGRNDFQVKLRGFRIELGEIESRLLACEGIAQAVAVVREDMTGDKRLVAYVVCDPARDKSGLVHTLRTSLSQSLPDYMVPTAFVVLDALPLTPNQKVDRKALPAPEGTVGNCRTYEPPQGALESQLATLWQDVLGVERVGRLDNFFALGGHSLLTVSLVGRLRALGWNADVRTVFSAPTLSALAAALERSAPAEEAMVPPNGIPAGATHITPEMVSLAVLAPGDIDSIVAQTPGGAANIQDVYPLAPLQEGIFFHHLASAEGDAYLLPFLFGVRDKKQLDAFLQAFQEVVNRHDVLRTAVVWESLPSPMQVVWRKALLPVENVLLGNAQDPVNALLARFDIGRYRMDLRQAPLLRVAIAEDPARHRWLLLVLLHHLVGDHATLEGIQGEVEAILSGRQDALPLPVPYRDLVGKALFGMRQEAHHDYFKEALGDVDTPTAPFDVLNTQGNGDIAEGRLPLDAKLSRTLREVARQAGTSPATLFHQGWAHVLALLTGQETVVFGTVLWGRTQAGTGENPPIGLFINTLPIKVVMDQRSVSDQLQALHGALADLLRHDSASLSLAQQCSGVPAPTPLFTTLLNYRRTPLTAKGGGDESDEVAFQLLHSQERTNYPFTLSVDDDGEGFALHALAHPALPPARLCHLMTWAMARLVEALAHAPHTPARALDCMPPDEHDLVVKRFNATAVSWPTEGDWLSEWEARVQEKPDATALLFRDACLTYGELNAQANRVAHYLRRLGVRANDCIGVCVARGFDLVVAVLGILKAGAAYVPLDASYPAERLTAMVDDARIGILLTQQALVSLLPKVGTVLCLDGSERPWQQAPTTHLVYQREPEHLAYVIFTSGSTGRPKGVAMPHRALTNLLHWQRARSKGGRTLQYSPISFDVSFQEMFSTLCAGDTLVLLGDEVRRDAVQLIPYLNAHGVRRLFLPYVALQQLADVAALENMLPNSLHEIITAGEQLKATPSVRALFKAMPHCRLENQYGPTETHVVTAYSLPAHVDGWADLPSIGAPIANSTLYILDTQGRPVPQGVAGEIYLGGVPVAQGYLHRPELTAERFLPDPFAGHGLLYKTGDVGRWEADGTVTYLLRADFQVKIRGFRVELGEVESRLAALLGVREAVVCAQEGSGGHKRLVAYVTPANALDEAALKTALSAALPDYMVPSVFVLLDRLPLSPSGKVNRKALPDPGLAGIHREYVAPIGDREVVLAGIWSTLLRVEKVGRFDHFFELGGHSLLAVSLIEKMREAGMRLDVRTLFASPVLATLAEAAGADAPRVVVPPNGIPPGCTHITPPMLPLAVLSQRDIDRLAAITPGGAANIQDIYPLSPLQEGMFFHYLLGGESDAYLLANDMAFDHRNALEAFLMAFQEVIDRHDILRTALCWEDLPEPMQVVWRRAPLTVATLTLSEPTWEAFKAICHPRRSRLDLRRAPMMKAHIAPGPGDTWFLSLHWHHLLGDHTTIDLIQSEIEAMLAGRADQLSAPMPYRHLVAQSRLGMSVAEHEAFFKGQLAHIEVSTAPFGVMNVQGDGGDILETRRPVDQSLATTLRATARRLGVSPAVLCHQAWGMVLANLTGQSEVVFGTVLFGRMLAGEASDRAIGLFINTLPLRVALGDLRTEAAVRYTHRQLADLLRHEHAPLALAQRCSGVASPAPLFTTLLNFRYSPLTEPVDGPSSLDAMRAVGEDNRTNYPILVSVDDLGQDFELEVQARQPISSSLVGEMMHQAMASLVEALSHAPAMPVGRLAVLPQGMIQTLLQRGRGSEALSLPQHSIHGLFEIQVSRTPEATALVEGEETLSYAQLNAQANRLAHHLQSLGVGPDHCVGLCVARSIAMVGAILAILKAGAAYVPLDTAYPMDRLSMMLEDAKVSLVLTQSALVSGLPSHVPTLCVDQGTERWEGLSDHNLEGIPSLDSLAYVIFTSGSTGRPKGVAMPHKTLVNLVQWQCERSQSQRTLQYSPISFDVSFQEIFATLASGGALVLVSESVRREPAALIRHLQAHHVDRLFLPFVALQQMAEVAVMEGRWPDSLREIITAGEQLKSTKALRQMMSAMPHCRLENQYGPTETHVVTAYPMPRETAQWAGLPPIGKPIAHGRVYVLDPWQKPVPQDVPGEIYLGGLPLARGYIGRPELTRERFVADPFAANATMYKTGDQGQWLADGNVAFLTRNDFQVKIRGFRVELGEVESHLLAHAGIQDVTVIAREDQPGDKRLVAYFTSAQPLEVESLRAHMLQRAPDYMVPAAFVQLPVLPLSPNGKVDRKALPVPTGDAFALRAFETPVGHHEQAVAEIWAEVLHLAKVGRQDHFFELGGHSLLMVQVVSRLRQRLGIEVPLAALFAKPVLWEFAAGLQGAEVTQQLPLVAMPRPLRIPLSFAQQRMWFLAQIEGASAAYHIPGGLLLRGDIQPMALRRALDTIVRRHEALRTTFIQEAGEPWQHIVAPEESAFPLTESFAGNEDALMEAVEANFSKPFDLARGPLVRGCLIRLGYETATHVLVLTLHHIVSDGWSMGRLVAEFNALYAAFCRGEVDPLPPLAIQYADYALWQRAWAETSSYQVQVAYWQQALAGALTLLDLPTDHPRPTVQDFQGDSVEFALDRTLVDGLKALARRHGATLFAVLMAGWAALLSRLSGQTDILLGTPSANRGSQEIEALIGFFVNTLTIRVDLSQNPTVSTLVQQVQAKSLAAQSHQDLPFEHVVERLNPPRSLAHTPLFQVMLTWQSNAVEEVAMGNACLEDLSITPYRAARFDLEFSLMEADGRVMGELDYATALFEGATVQRWLDSYSLLLTAMAANDQQTVEAIPLLTPEEIHLLTHWNATSQPVPPEAVHTLFEQWVARTPEAAAIHWQEQVVSYAQLNHMANAIAQGLLALRLTQESRVGLLVERGVGLVAGLLGILKAGCAYVPMDPLYPADRLQHILADSGAVVLLTQGELAQRLGVVSCDSALTVLDLDSLCQPLSHGEITTPACGLGDLAYVIYTSGSTGKPKGVMVEQGGVVNMLAHFRQQLGITAADRVLGLTTITFDIAALEIFLPLTSGASLVLASRKEALDPALLAAQMAQSGVTVMQATPVTWQMLVGSGWKGNRSLKALCGGEAMGVELARSLRERVGALWNVYGPTETTVWSTAAFIGPDTPLADTLVSIGQPIANTTIHILNGAGQPVPLGAPGELYIGGRGVARGYQRLPDLTATRFVRDPFAEAEPAGYAPRLYSTGDLAKWLPSGQIVFLGRNDFQVKIRGFRIELGEIESCLLAQEGVQQAVVIPWESAGDKRLAAYVVSQPGMPLANLGEAEWADSLRRHAASHLPDYMLPTAFVRLDAMPLTPSGKVDRRALPHLEGSVHATQTYVAPEGERETRLAALWSKVLKVEQVGRFDNFFNLGGHSLLILTLLEDMAQAGLYTDVQALFISPTLADFAAQVRDTRENFVVPENKLDTAAPVQDGDEDEPEIEVDL